MIYRLIVIGMVLVLLAACAGTSPTGDSPAASAPSPSLLAETQPEITNITMRLQWIPQYQFAGYIVAKQKGYYQEAGLEVELLPGSPDFVPLPLVVSGTDTFGSTGADTVLIAREKDIPVVALATIFQTSPVGFMVHSDSGIETPQDFVGQQVGVFYGDNVETEYRALLAATGVDRADIEEVPAQFTMEPFLSRRMDVYPVYATDQPDLARSKGAEVEVIVARDFGVTLMGDVLFATEEFVANNPNTTRAFVHATLRGWQDALNNPQEAIQLVAAYNPQLSEEHLQFEASETIKLVQYGAGETCPGWNDQSAWEAEQTTLLDLDILSAPVSLEQAINNRFVHDYYQQQGITCP